MTGPAVLMFSFTKKCFFFCVLKISEDYKITQENTAVLIPTSPFSHLKKNEKNRLRIKARILCQY